MLYYQSKIFVDIKAIFVGILMYLLIK